MPKKSYSDNKITTLSAIIDEIRRNRSEMEKFGGCLSKILQEMKDLKKTWEQTEQGMKKEKEKAERPRILFYEDRVEISDCKPLSKDYPMRLMERVILRSVNKGKEKTHWLWAYVTFPKFRATHPKNQVRNYVSKKRTLLADKGISILLLKKEGDNFIKLEKIDSNVISNIKDVMDWYEKAVSLHNQGDIGAAIKELSKIVESEYKWHSFTEAHLKLAEWILEEEFEGISEELIEQSKDFLTSYKRRLKNGTSGIERYRKKIEALGISLDEESEEEVRAIEKELNKVEGLLSAVMERNPSKIEDSEYEALVDLIQEAQHHLASIEEEPLRVGQREELTLRLVEKLSRENNGIRQIIKNALIYWDREQEKSSRRVKEWMLEGFEKAKRWIYCCAVETIGELSSFERFERKGINRLGSLKNYLLEELQKKIKRKMGRSKD